MPTASDAAGAVGAVNGRSRFLLHNRTPWSSSTAGGGDDMQGGGVAPANLWARRGSGEPLPALTEPSRFRNEGEFASRIDWLSSEWKGQQALCYLILEAAARRPSVIAAAEQARREPAHLNPHPDAELMGGRGARRSILPSQGPSNCCASGSDGLSCTPLPPPPLPTAPPSATPASAAPMPTALLPTVPPSATPPLAFEDSHRADAVGAPAANGCTGVLPSALSAAAAALGDAVLPSTQLFGCGATIPCNESGPTASLPAGFELMEPLPGATLSPQLPLATALAHLAQVPLGGETDSEAIQLEERLQLVQREVLQLASTNAKLRRENAELMREFTGALCEMKSAQRPVAEPARQPATAASQSALSPR